MPLPPLLSPVTLLSRIEIVPPHTYRYYLEEPVTSASRPRPRGLIFLGMDPRRGPSHSGHPGGVIKAVHAPKADGSDL